jgi:hypothetical protein
MVSSRGCRALFGNLFTDKRHAQISDREGDHLAGEYLDRLFHLIWVASDHHDLAFAHITAQP